jgi:hypothetical protein
MSALTKLANGMDCQIRIPGVCNFRSETTVLAHYRLAGLCGGSLKPPDLIGAWACSACHDYVDGRTKIDAEEKPRARLAHAEGVLRTIYALIKRGKVKT